MNRESVVSSNLESVGYDPRTMTLEIEFRDGSVYEYYKVPPHLHEGLLAAGSHGKYLNAEIKTRYDYKKIS